MEIMLFLCISPEVLRLHGRKSKIIHLFLFNLKKLHGDDDDNRQSSVTKIKMKTVVD